jgi:putative two-component system response regulator
VAALQQGPPGRRSDPLAAEWPATILVADDDAPARHVLVRILESAGYAVIQAADGSTARQVVSSEMPDLLMLDINMPGTDGIDLCREVKSDPRTNLVPVIHVTGSIGREDRLAALRAGSDEFVAKPFDVEELLTRVRALLRTRRLTAQLVSAEAVMIALAKTVEARDMYTERHLYRVAERAVRVAHVMGLSGLQLETVRLGGLLHDLGKIGVPDAILLKPGILTRDEFEQIKLHPGIGAEIVRPLGPFSAPEPVVLHHHERLDGAGYPDGLRGDGIPLAARIVAVSDAFDAITSDRPYRAVRTPEVGLQILRDGRGSQWDPAAVDAFCDIYGDLGSSAVIRTNGS